MKRRVNGHKPRQALGRELADSLVPMHQLGPDQVLGKNAVVSLERRDQRGHVDVCCRPQAHGKEVGDCENINTVGKVSESAHAFLKRGSRGTPTVDLSVVTGRRHQHGRQRVQRGGHVVPGLRPRQRPADICGRVPHVGPHARVPPPHVVLEPAADHVHEVVDPSGRDQLPARQLCDSQAPSVPGVLASGHVRQVALQDGIQQLVCKLGIELGRQSPDALGRRPPHDRIPIAQPRQQSHHSRSQQLLDAPLL